MDGQNSSGMMPDEQDDYRSASQSMADYARQVNQSHKKPKHTGRRIAVWFFVLVLLAGAGGAGYWFVLREKPATTPKQTATDTPKTAEKTQTIATATKHYSSTEFVGLEFDYPKDWTVKETSGSGVLTATSPGLQLKDASGDKAAMQVVYTIRNKQQALPEFDKGNAVAAVASEKINYAKPSSVQRGSTYVSFLRYASTTSSSGINGLYITGDTGYQVGQAIPKADFTPVDPVISITFLTCKDSNCSGTGTPATIADSVWADATFASPIKTMLASLVVN
ncbi:MAG TPA: hypothetical protein VMY99_01120 [Nevskiaceae bacterium]|nr:hypothetical protein [Nevskiaceae bacterium]